MKTDPRKIIDDLKSSMHVEYLGDSTRKVNLTFVVPIIAVFIVPLIVFLLAPLMVFFQFVLFWVLLLLVLSKHSLLGDQPHDDITTKVYRRLLLRHGVLDQVEELSGEHEANKNYEYVYGVLNSEALQSNLISQYIRLRGESLSDEDCRFCLDSLNTSKSSNAGFANNSHDSFLLLPGNVRSYNLAVTDLFVEKALSYLNRKASDYSLYGKSFMFIVVVTMLCGVVVSYIAFANPTSNFIGSWSIFKDLSLFNVKQIDPLLKGERLWVEFAGNFVKAFTFYGLLVTLAVFSYRMARAMFDQAERIKDRRHSLRQGRLFVHLNGGKVTVDELDKAFSWNATHANAFSNIDPEAQAPWGNVVKELLRTVRETSKEGIKSVAKLKGAD